MKKIISAASFLANMNFIFFLALGIIQQDALLLIVALQFKLVAYSAKFKPEIKAEIEKLYEEDNSNDEIIVV